MKFWKRKKDKLNIDKDFPQLAQISCDKECNVNLKFVDSYCSRSKNPILSEQWPPSPLIILYLLTRHFLLYSLIWLTIPWMYCVRADYITPEIEEARYHFFYDNNLGNTIPVKLNQKIYLSGYEKGLKIYLSFNCCI